MNNSCIELLADWRAGKEIQTAIMGGLGSSYEQVIHELGMDMLEILMIENHDFSKDYSDEEWREIWKVLDHKFDTLLEKSDISRCSGAQWGAAKNLAAVFYRNGVSKALEMIPEDRKIYMRTKR